MLCKKCGDGNVAQQQVPKPSFYDRSVERRIAFGIYIKRSNDSRPLYMVQLAMHSMYRRFRDEPLKDAAEQGLFHLSYLYLN